VLFGKRLKIHSFGDFVMASNQTKFFRRQKYTMMQPDLRLRKQNFPIDIQRVAGLISNTQHQSGEIPWCEGEKTDPWDHIEAAMGLGIGGYIEEARRAYQWLAQMQLDDGSWYAAYVNGIPVDKTRDTNFSAYIAVGVFQYYLITGDTHFLKEMWPSVRSAITFVLNLQGPVGEIFWAVCPEGKIDATALLTGSCSVYMSIKCATAIAKVLNITVPEWEAALIRLRHALVNRANRKILGDVRHQQQRGSMRIRPSMGNGCGNLRAFFGTVGNGG
jgi:hypothetical protein